MEFYRNFDEFLASLDKGSDIILDTQKGFNVFTLTMRGVQADESSVKILCFEIFYPRIRPICIILIKVDIV